jgi:serine/threonine-protein kinase RsbW
MIQLAASRGHAATSAHFCAQLHSHEDRYEVLDGLVAAMSERHYSEHDIFAMRLAVEEAIANAIKHGNHEDRRLETRVALTVGPDQVLAEVEDMGAGFKPEAVNDPLAVENLEQTSGRGLYLMRSLTSWLRYNERGNKVTLCRRRAQGSALEASHEPE